MVTAMPNPAGSVNASHHDHARCVAAALAAAERTCEARGLRLTPMRRRVLELIWQGHSPVKAYAILDALSGTARRLAPPTVYRALDFLQEAGLVHRVASGNAFVGCAHPELPHRGHLLICEECGTVLEVAESAAWATIAEEARELGFEAHADTLEVRGRCAACRPPRA